MKQVQAAPLQIDALPLLKFEQRYVKMEEKKRSNHLNKPFPFEF